MKALKLKRMNVMFCVHFYEETVPSFLVLKGQVTHKRLRTTGRDGELFHFRIIVFTFW